MEEYWYYNQYYAINQLIINKLPVKNLRTSIKKIATILMGVLNYC